MKLHAFPGTIRPAHQRGISIDDFDSIGRAPGIFTRVRIFFAECLSAIELILVLGFVLLAALCRAGIAWVLRKK